MSFKPEVIADDSGGWAGNALRFATRDEAEENVASLADRWLLVRETRVVESADAVNYAWVNTRLVSVEEGERDRTLHHAPAKYRLHSRSAS
jgi:hypothetical protein